MCKDDKAGRFVVAAAAAKTAAKEDEERAEEDRRISRLDSTKSFAAFLAQRPNYQPPKFLQQVLKLAVEATSQQQQQQQQEQKDD